MLGCKGKHVVHGCSVIVIIDMGGNGYIVHVNTDESTKELMLSYDRAENVVHHCLKGSGGAGVAKNHDSWFIEAVKCLEGAIVFVTFLDADIIISPADVQLCINMGAP